MNVDDAVGKTVGNVDGSGDDRTSTIDDHIGDGALAGDDWVHGATFP